MKMIEDEKCHAVSFLLIDDDSIDRKNIKRAFQELGYCNTIIEAENGKQGLKLLKTMESPFVVLVDLSMPVMDGFDFLQELRREASYDRTRIFVLTTSGLKSDKAKVGQYNISGYISKENLANGLAISFVEMLAHYGR